VATNKVTPFQQQAFNNTSKNPASPKPQKPRPGGEVESLEISPEAIAINQYAQPNPFGAYPKSLVSHPNDAIQLDIFNDQDFYFESISQATNYNIQGSQITVDLEAELRNVGYEAGDFRVSIRPIRNYLGSAASTKLIIQEVSPDRLEVRVIPAQINAGNTLNTEQAIAANQNFADFFANGFFELDKQLVLAGLYLFTDSRTSFSINDYIQDRFTIPTSPYSIIFKLNEPLPIATNVNSLIWIAQEVNAPVIEDIIMVPLRQGRDLRVIKGPNFDIIRKKTLATNSEYLGWDEILQYNERPLTRTIFSQSLVEGIELNVDYTRFENFVKFGSAYDRVKNFEYKIRLLENYQAVSSSLASSNASESFYVQTQITSTLSKMDAVIGAFDGYERYMYFESSSYVTNSFGEFLDMAWPKSGSSKPYTLHSYSSSQAENWLSGILTSASLHDNINPNALYKLVPSHIQEGNEDIVDSFIKMLGHFFDIQYEYINQLPKIHDRQEKLTEGFAKELVYHIGTTLGIDFSNGDNFEDLWSYTLGLDSDGVSNNTLQITGDDRTREVWKRIINNLPLLLKSKGTERGVRALINCFGIPSTILRIKEFGGPEPELDKTSQYKHDRFYYMTQVGNDGGNFQYIEIPFKDLAQSGKLPKSVEWRMQMAPSQSASQRLAVVGSAQVSAIDGNSIRFTIGGSNVLFSSSIYDGTPHSFALVSNAASTATTLYVTKVNYGVATTVSGTIATSLGAGSGMTYIPNSTNTTPFSGSVHEIRYWTDPLSLRVVQAHALAPTSFFTDDLTTETGGTGSYTQLGLRITAGSDNKKIDYSVTTNVTSSHPDRSITTFDGGATSLAATFVNFAKTGAVPLAETHYLEWPDIAGNRQVSNKVRVDSIINTSDQLYTNIKTQASLQDNQPVDSPRLGVYLSPTDEVNQDIAEQFGGLTMDDFIGSYNDVYNEGYDDLRALRGFYLKKVLGRYNSQNYIRLLQYFNASVFTIIKQLVPHRANLQTGLVIEPDLLTRNKARIANRPVYEDQYNEGVLDLPSIEEPTADIKIIEDGLIDMPETEIESVYVGTPEGTLNGTQMLSLSAKANEYNNYQVPSQGTRLATMYSGSTPGSLINKKEALEDDIYIYETSYGRDKHLGSQYNFYTWYGPVEDPTAYAYLGLVSNSAGFIYAPAVSEDYSNPIGTQVYDSRASELLSPGDIVYKQGGDILRGEAQGKGWTETNLAFSGSYEQIPIARLGVRFFPAGTATNTYWLYLSAANALLSPGSAFSTITIPLPYEQAPDAVYELSWQGSSLTSIQFGSSEYVYLAPSDGTIQSKAGGGVLTILAGGSKSIQNLKLSIINYPGQFQDYHIGPNASIGQRNQKYNGCKLTSPDFNEDSPDTIDGGPVITITEGPAINLNVNPNQDGTYTFR